MPIITHPQFQKRPTDGSGDDSPPMLVSEKVYQLFKRDIITGALEAGRPLTEALLTKRFGASRTPIREACARLHNEKLLESVPNKGYSVAPISIQHIQERYQVRLLLEEFTVQEVCGKREPQFLAKIEALAHVTAKLGDRESCLQFIDSNRDFHLTIAELAGNQCVANVLSDVMNELARVGYLTVNHEDDLVAREEHARIVEAIMKGERAMARQAIHDHIQGSKDRILKAIWH